MGHPPRAAGSLGGLEQPERRPGGIGSPPSGDPALLALRSPNRCICLSPFPQLPRAWLCAAVGVAGCFPKPFLPTQATSAFSEPPLHGPLPT